LAVSSFSIAKGPYYQQKENIRLLLGQWHTSKDMCSILITIFSGYGIFNLAASLEKVVDYSATCHVLELIWAAVGIAINRYLNNKDKIMDDIKNDENDVLKV